MSDKYYVEFPEVAVNALKQGKWVIIELDDLYCKVMPYPIDEQIVVFKFEGRKDPKPNSP